MEAILSLDCGTQSIRAMLFDVNGNLLHKSRIEIEPYKSPQPGWAEQEADYYWDKLCEACQQLWQHYGHRRPKLAGVSLTTQRSTLINLDKNGKPLRPAIHWLDQRRIARQQVVGPLANFVYQLVKMDYAVQFAYAECEANWIMKYQPEIWEQTHKYLFLSGYLTYKLIGEFVDSVGCQVGYVPFDYKKMKWADRTHLNRRLFPIELEKLPQLMEPAKELGRISKLAAEATGIPAGTPVIAAAADKACEILGVGGVKPNIACLSYGTTCTTSIMTQKYIEVIPFIPPYPSAIPKTYNTEIQIFRGFWMVSWFKEEFGYPEKELASQNNIAPETLFDDLIKDIPPGSLGLMLQPYWAPGVKVPGPEAKGAVIGFGDVHGRAHLYRSILEGLVYALREGTERTEKRSRVKISEVRVSGGGSQSNQAMQITADIFNLPARRSKIYETSGLGAAIDCAVGLKIYPDFGTAVQQMTAIGDTFEPIADHVELYEALFQRVYKKMYAHLKPLYAEIKDITGYPER
ncbi:MAG: FGGY-family carbohydrate kinase [candidate division KSB1 bacterium]|nr:FGGY-family carbohydrate kinase [candidate division KSB1 bacterium]MDZ7342199.1 FGGY-family carbohydrate kinase [candidate division KSB1 bacterium]